MILGEGFTNFGAAEWIAIITALTSGIVAVIGAWRAGNKAESANQNATQANLKATEAVTKANCVERTAEAASQNVVDLAAKIDPKSNGK